ncbi:MAG: hypothetical protein WC373_12200 [Smithella sp.]|jgi:hypothetical protein
MSFQLESLGLILLRNQTARGTVEGTPVAGDILEAEVGASISIDPRVKDIDLVGSPQNASVIGPRECGISLSIPFRTGAAKGNQLQMDQALLSCYMAVTASDTDSDSTDDRFIYIPSYKDSEWKDSTIWAYSGCQDTDLALLYVLQNCSFGAKISLDFNDAIASLSLEGKGVLSATPALATQPTVTPSTVVPPALIGATINFLGDSDYIPAKIDFDLGPDIYATLKPTAASGLGITTPGAKRKVKWSAKVYHDSGVTPFTTLLAGTTGTISVSWGTVPNKFTVSTTKAQIRTCKISAENNVTCYDLEGICVDNDFAIQIDTAVA